MKLNRFAACDDVLTRLAVHDPGAVELAVCWDLLSTSHGTVPIAELAAEIGYSRQHLTRRFRDEFGLSPKRAGRVMRFDRDLHHDAGLRIDGQERRIGGGALGAQLGQHDRLHFVPFNKFRCQTYTLHLSGLPCTVQTVYRAYDGPITYSGPVYLKSGANCLLQSSLPYALATLGSEISPANFQAATLGIE